MKLDRSILHSSVTIGLCLVSGLVAGSMRPATAAEPHAEESVSFTRDPRSDEEPKAIPLFSIEAPAGSVHNVYPGEIPADSELTALQEQDMRDQSAELQPRMIGEIRPSIQYAWGDVDVSTLPDDFTVNTDDEPISRAVAAPMLLQWQAPSLWYHPLYFEDPALERYGHTYSPFVQSLASTGRFVGQAATLPWHATLRPYGSREYPLGWHRPGERVPYRCYRPAWNDEAAVNQALAVVGLVFLFP